MKQTFLNLFWIIFGIAMILGGGALVSHFGFADPYPLWGGIGGASIGMLIYKWVHPESEMVI